MKAASHTLLVATAAAGLFAASQFGFAEGPAVKANPKIAGNANESEANPIAYLGVTVEKLHPALASHFLKWFEKEQGVLVVTIEPDSPAAQAGLKAHDILLTYNGQKVLSPEQFARMVRSDKPRQAVTLGIIRGGQQETVKVVLGKREPGESTTAENRPMSHRAWRMPGTSESQPRSGDNDGQTGWERFDSMTLKNLGNNRFHVEIQYLDNQGQLQRHGFEGTREEIRSKIDAEKDLPRAERHHLLQGLDLQDMSRGAFGLNF